jgi:hypothetical protein
VKKRKDDFMILITDTSKVDHVVKVEHVF